MDTDSTFFSVINQVAWNEQLCAKVSPIAQIWTELVVSGDGNEHCEPDGPSIQEGGISISSRRWQPLYDQLGS
jgi:hypothetical protein